MGDRHDGHRGRGRAAAALAAAVLALVDPASAQAIVVTIGTPTADFGNSSSCYSCGPSCTVFQRAPLGAAPADGTITSWRVAGVGSFALAVLRPTGSGLAVAATGGAQAVGGTAPATIPANIPVRAGDTIGVDLFGGNPSSRIFLRSDATGNVGVDSPAMGTGAMLIGQNPATGDLDLNADVALAPVATALDVSSGPTTGGTVVTISGSYLDGTTSVLFGGQPATFAAGPNGTLVAHTPAAAAVGAVDVVVRAAGRLEHARRGLHLHRVAVGGRRHADLHDAGRRRAARPEARPSRGSRCRPAASSSRPPDPGRRRSRAALCSATRCLPRPA